MRYIKYEIESSMMTHLRDPLSRLDNKNIITHLQFHLSTKIWDIISDRAGQVVIYDQIKHEIHEQKSNEL